MRNEFRGAILQSLSLSGNFLRTLDGRLTHSLGQLRRLHLGHNMITHLPVVLPPEYYHLTVRAPPLPHRLPPYCQMLNLSANQLSQLPDNLQVSLPKLEELDLSFNRFSSFSLVSSNFIDSIDRVYLAGTAPPLPP